MSELYYVAGLPRSGATMMINILKQNPQIHGEAVSSLSSIFSSVFFNWDKIEFSIEYNNEKAKINVLKSILNSYHSHHQKQFIFDKDRMWITRIGILEALFEKKVKILCPVRNPAEILASFEKIRKNNPLQLTMTDEILAESSSIASRAFHYAGPNGALGLAHAGTRDAVTMGYLDRLLFIDYNRFCNSPKSQLKRIYDFFELPSFEHDLQNIEQTEIYNDLASKLPNLHKIKPKLDKTTVNCVEYLGLDLYQQYNREIFWDAWI
jgi:sulfotransferase